jgi:release factor glutamine methyltransferase
MKAGIALIRKELTGIYSKQEIESLIFLIFNKLKGYTRTKFLLSREEQLSENERDHIKQIINRLKNHEPVQYVLGETEFYGLNFQCIPGVLIPRPETEELVEWILSENQMTNPCIFDIGTGTGCIAVSLQKNIPQSHVLACDISPVCLETVTKNAKANHADIEVLDYNILDQQTPYEFPSFDIIVSNPPYVREMEKIFMAKNVTDFEPGLALFVPDNNPLLFYEAIADFSIKHLKNEGKLFFEINEVFGSDCCNILTSKGFLNITLKKDIHGKNRMIGCSLQK